MDLIYTLYIGPNEGSSNICGYENIEDLLNSLLLSSTVSGKNFSKCNLYCNSRALQLIKQDDRQFPFSKIYTVLDELDSWLLKENWAYSKIMTYSKQQHPFVHLDCDAFLADGLPPELLKKKFAFQQEENLSSTCFGYYNAVFKEAKRFDILPAEITILPEFAMNMGLFGCMQNDSLYVIRNYCATVLKYLQLQQEKYDQLYFKKEQSMLFEQLFIVNTILECGLKINLDFDTLLDKNGRNKFLPAYRYSHFIRGVKRNEIVTGAIKKELRILGLDK